MTTDPKPEEPTELSKWHEAADAAGELAEFLEWMIAEHGVVLTWESAKPSAPKDSRDIIMDYVGVDPVKLEVERRELLDKLREAQAKPV